MNKLKDKILSITLDDILGYVGAISWVVVCMCVLMIAMEYVVANEWRWFPVELLLVVMIFVTIAGNIGLRKFIQWASTVNIKK